MLYSIINAIGINICKVLKTANDIRKEKKTLFIDFTDLLVIYFPYTIIDKIAMMVKVQDAFIAYSTMPRSCVRFSLTGVAENDIFCLMILY